MIDASFANDPLTKGVIHQSASRGRFQESPGRAPEPLEGGVSTLTD